MLKNIHVLLVLASLGLSAVRRVSLHKTGRRTKIQKFVIFFMASNEGRNLENGVARGCLGRTAASRLRA